MEARLIRQTKWVILFEVFFLLGLLTMNSLATSLGLMPSKELVRNLQSRSSRAGRKVREIFE